MAPFRMGVTADTCERRLMVLVPRGDACPHGSQTPCDEALAGFAFSVTPVIVASVKRFPGARAVFGVLFAAHAVACDPPTPAVPVPTSAVSTVSTKAKAPDSEPTLGRTCNTDRDCDAAAPRCLGFGEDDYVASTPVRAVVEHCSRPCDAMDCPSGYACRRAPSITGVKDGQIVGTVAFWCGRQVNVTPTPLPEIPRHVVARYLAQGGLIMPVVALYWDRGDRVVTGPGFEQRYTNDKDARASFLTQAAAVRAWKELWPATVPLGPNAPGAISPAHQKTLYRVAETEAVAAISTPERVAHEGAVLVWALRGGRGLTLYGATASPQFDVESGLDAFFAIAPPR